MNEKPVPCSFSTDDYVTTTADEESIRHKMHDFQTLTGTRSALHPVLVTPYGCKANSHAGVYQSVVTADSLFG